MSPSLRVLVVDDEPLVLRALCRVLRPICEPFPAASAAAALQLAPTLRPAALVTDLRLRSREDGLWLVAALRAAGHPLPAVVVTATPEDPGLAEALVTGRIVAVLEKPWRTEELLLAVRGCLAGGGPVRRA